MTMRVKYVWKLSKNTLVKITNFRLKNWWSTTDEPHFVIDFYLPIIGNEFDQVLILVSEWIKIQFNKFVKIVIRWTQVEKETILNDGKP